MLSWRTKKRGPWSFIFSSSFLLAVPHRSSSRIQNFTSERIPLMARGILQKARESYSKTVSSSSDNFVRTWKKWKGTFYLSLYLFVFKNNNIYRLASKAISLLPIEKQIDSSKLWLESRTEPKSMLQTAYLFFDERKLILLWFIKIHWLWVWCLIIAIRSGTSCFHVNQ